MPKRNPTPVVSCFIGARSWQGEGIPYGDITEPLKSRVDEFLEKTGLNYGVQKNYFF